MLVEDRLRRNRIFRWRLDRLRFRLGLDWQRVLPGQRLVRRIGDDRGLRLFLRWRIVRHNPRLRTHRQLLGRRLTRTIGWSDRRRRPSQSLHSLTLPADHRRELIDDGGRACDSDRDPVLAADGRALAMRARGPTSACARRLDVASGQPRASASTSRRQEQHEGVTVLRRRRSNSDRAGADSSDPSGWEDQADPGRRRRRASERPQPIRKPAAAPATAEGMPSSNIAAHAVAAWTLRPTTSPTMTPAAPVRSIPAIAQFPGDGSALMSTMNALIPSAIIDPTTVPCSPNAVIHTTGTGRGCSGQSARAARVAPATQPGQDEHAARGGNDSRFGVSAGRSGSLGPAAPAAKKRHPARECQGYNEHRHPRDRAESPQRRRSSYARDLSCSGRRDREP
jgi:hypothetical protein